MVQENTYQTGKTVTLTYSDADNTMVRFAYEVLQKLEPLQVETKLQVIEHDFVELPFKGRTYRKDYEQHKRATIHNDNIQVQFNTKSTDEVELWWMQVSDDKRGTGLGTDIMNDILDVADELGVKVTLVPVSLTGGSQERLRQWYRSLEFKAFKAGSPYMCYTPQK